MRGYLLLTLAIPAFCADSAGPAEAQTFFEMKVRPVLAKNCFACHTSSKMGGLEMRSRDTLLKGGKSGPAIVSGDPDHSLLVRAVRQEDEKLKMPPQGKLKDDEISQLAAWVKDGAVWPDARATSAKAGDYVISPEQRAFWSFQPLRRPEVPKVQASRWVRNPIDQFILAKLEEKGVAPSAAADRRTLI